MNLDNIFSEEFLRKLVHEISGELTQTIIDSIKEEGMKSIDHSEMISFSTYSEKHKISRTKLYEMAHNGLLDVYQIPSSPRKYLKDDPSTVFQLVETPSRQTTFLEFEKELKAAIKQGEESQRILRKFKQTGRPKEELARWLWEHNYRDITKRKQIVI